MTRYKESAMLKVMVHNNSLKLMIIGSLGTGHAGRKLHVRELKEY